MSIWFNCDSNLNTNLAVKYNSYVTWMWECVHLNVNKRRQLEHYSGSIVWQEEQAGIKHEGANVKEHCSSMAVKTQYTILSPILDPNEQSDREEILARYD